MQVGEKDKQNQHGLNTERKMPNPPMTELESNGHIKKTQTEEILYLNRIFSACSVLFVSSVASLQKKNLVSEPEKDQVVCLKPIKQSSQFLGLFPDSLETFPEIAQGMLNQFTDSHSPSMGTPLPLRCELCDESHGPCMWTKG